MMGSVRMSRVAGGRFMPIAIRSCLGAQCSLLAEAASVFHRGTCSAWALGVSSHGHPASRPWALGVRPRGTGRHDVNLFVPSRYFQESPKTFSRRGSDCGQQVAHSYYCDSLSRMVRRR